MNEIWQSGATSSRILTVTVNPAIDQTITIPNFRVGEVNRVIEERSDPGGKGVNVAAFLADFGYAISATGLLGQENTDLFQKLFLQKGIDDYFIRIPGKTRVNVKILDAVGQQVTDINYPGHLATVADVEDLELVLMNLATSHPWVVLAGSVPTSLPTTLYRDFITRLKAQGNTVVLDASGESLQAALSATPDLVKPNLEELEDLVGRSLPSEAAIAAAAQDLVRQGIRYVVVSMGAQGAILASADTVIHAQPPAVTPKSTVGAGDAMLAGLVTALKRGYDLAACGRLATGFAVAALGQVGHCPLMPETVAAWCDRVTIRPLL
ncbi:MAG: 1-phosphofructokinase [Synechococcales bacterium]|nr:1-phosphofructokinase [Synechococcales bacterium]